MHDVAFCKLLDKLRKKKRTNEKQQGNNTNNENLYVRVFFLTLGENTARIAREYLKIRILYTIYELILAQSNAQAL